MFNIYVGNLSFDASEDDIRELFSAHGTVEKVNFITDRETGRPRGFGFIEMADEEEGRAAITALNGADHLGRSLRVNEAKPREDRGGGGGGGRGGGGDRW